MAASTGQNKESVSTSDADLLLHPELLSQDFMRLILKERNVGTRACEDRDRLTELYLRHVIPLPQRTLPNNRWGRRMQKSRGRQTAAGHSSCNDQHRKRPLIVFDGKSSQSGPLKVKKPEGTKVSAGVTDRLKPPPAANLSNPIRKLSGTSSSSSSSTHRGSETANLKQDTGDSGALKSPEVKKKIQHITWP
ncbi:ashwin [Xiphophorus couchianus]|uniref:ashwin n=1 Tax=Xiphophorus couchianus TaxID=32473 RepID=UPI001016D3F2|nr:ashwin [Xiphophorus couchianus]